MTDLPVEEQAAMEVAINEGWNHYVSLNANATVIWLAAREYSKQREEELAQGLAERVGRYVLWVKPHKESRSCVQVEGGGFYWGETPTDALRAALAENGDSGSGRCGRVMVGYGGEGSHLPTCRLPEGHEGRCSTDESDGLGHRRGR